MDLSPGGCTLGVEPFAAQQLIAACAAAPEDENPANLASRDLSAFERGIARKRWALLCRLMPVSRH